jgi:release factor glutamine methyltransferase
MKNTTIRVAEIFKLFGENLAHLYSQTEIKQIAYLLFESCLNWTKPRVHLSYQEVLTEQVTYRLLKAMAELQSGKPIQYIIGVSWFNDAKLKVDNSVLIPRPETEELCALIRSDIPGHFHPGFAILDIGTGSGCIAIDLKRNFPNVLVSAIDISPDALKLAWENANQQQCDVDFSLADILNPIDQNKLGKFDLIVSNPPYVTESERKFMHVNVRMFEPSVALFVPDEDPLKFYTTIIGFAKKHLCNPGWLYFEINEKYGSKIKEMLMESKFTQVEIFNDLNSRHRFIRAVSEVQ